MQLDFEVLERKEFEFMISSGSKRHTGSCFSHVIVIALVQDFQSTFNTIIIKFVMSVQSVLRVATCVTDTRTCYKS